MAAFGYFGHMWELYTFWAFIPVMIGFYQLNASAEIAISFWSFVVIAAGGIGCILGGYVSLSKGSKGVAQMSLLVSGFCCLAVPFIFNLPDWLFLGIMIIWGSRLFLILPIFYFGSRFGRPFLCCNWINYREQPWLCHYNCEYSVSYIIMD